MRHPTLKPTYDKSRERWRLAIPATYSSTGKRRNQYFATKRLAQMEAERLRGNQSKYGTESSKLSGTDAQDAARALSALREAGSSATLHSIIMAHLKHVDTRSKSITLSELWVRHTEAKGGKSEAYQRTFAIVQAKVIDRLPRRKVCDLTKDDIEAAIRKDNPSHTTFNLILRTLSPAFNRAVREGWATENVCKRIERHETKRRTVAVLSLAQARKLMTSARDYRNDSELPEWLQVDASGATAALALMLFAGVRPAEVTRLDWNDIDMDAGTVFVSNEKAKTDRSRFFDMPDTLLRWLETVPASQRHGAIVPPNWKKCWQAIRRKVGITDERDQCRKSFASYHLQAFGDVNLTRAIMGHEHGDVIFQHYRGLVRPKDAKAFWQITPSAPFKIVRSA